MPEVSGSDHCPVWATLDWEVIPSKKCPNMCTRFMPEFVGKQQKLLSFLVKKDGKNMSVTRHSPDLQSSQESSDSGVFVEFSGNNPDQSTGEDQSTFIVKTNHQRMVCSGTDLKKRIASTQIHGGSKKSKKGDNTFCGRKQGSLLAFFDKKHSEKSSDSKEATAEDVTSVSEADVERVMNTDSEKAVADTKQPQLNAASASWKSLLKGPPAPPLCKGHKEPCVLRTVKKDSLNKGRQFWVCSRPEGHKSNPDARCDYFVWVTKKK
ncbi:hypothetical protein LSH36_172g03042 [Paralvinella palmiformis]|uniref:GRF-type domain-containing protein n=1 Tax=Paralvinella palmiformis TaxID=53620 RepID=A0AAD9JSV2_9ANNE|nr:hypothetical protein LSH36_172g03042 [Paralvinella palmiformis]